MLLSLHRAARICCGSLPVLMFMSSVRAESECGDCGARPTGCLTGSGYGPSTGVADARPTSTAFEEGAVDDHHRAHEVLEGD